MVDSEEYDLLPHKKVEELKKELEQLKSNPVKNSPYADSLTESINKFSRSVDRLYFLFENVQKEILDEYKKGEKPEDKLDKVIEQNRDIAKGIISLTESISKRAPEETRGTEPWQARQEPVEHPPVKRQAQGKPMENKISEILGENNEGQRTPPANTSSENPLDAQSAHGPENNPGQQDTQNPFQQHMEIPPPPVNPNYPTMENYPSVQGPEPQLNALHAEPGKKKKRFLGLF